MLPGEHKILLSIDAAGTIRFVYDDALADLIAEGKASAVRASTVEPEPFPSSGSLGWMVDLALSDGPRTGPFHHRSDALSYERRWLEENVIGGKQ